MGFRLSWVAVKGITPARALEELGLVDTGWKLRDFHESPYAGAKTEAGWYVIVCKEGWSPVLEEGALLALSRQADVLAGDLDEAVMSSRASAYRGGAKCWELIHDPGEGREHLLVTGTPPDCLAEIRERHLQKQRTGKPNVDAVFDVPLEVLRSLAGFRHDRNPPGNIEAFSDLEPGKS
ncbi:hypothetical protein LZ198_38105 [Myxococcus sp. K15C18031901]|uniref:hypothetical protein n=1 Tax=Myxococcus dinghuensis TaxID=2906761 RepID=UPI0020A78C7C|nr:hypothetical protein [Myxococcus dinghuensis]MCP3104695.1 hypothetical protein [Myxococcus dinghuensis]